MFPCNQVMKEAFEYPEDLIRETEAAMNEEINNSKNRKGKTKKKNQKKKSIYFKMRVVGKVGDFINKMKAGPVLNQPEFKSSELKYLKVDGMEKNVENVSIYYENNFLLFCQIWSYVLFLAILWRATFELVLGRLGETKVLEGAGLFTCIIFGILNINS